MSFPPLNPADPITVFGLKMAVCMAVFLAAALGLRAFARRGRAGPFARASTAAPGSDDAERRLHLQTIRLLIKELNRCDPGNEEAAEAALLFAAVGRRPGNRAFSE